MAEIYEKESETHIRITREAPVDIVPVAQLVAQKTFLTSQIEELQKHLELVDKHLAEADKLGIKV